MVSRSYSNLLDLSAPDASSVSSPRGRRLPRVMTVAGFCSGGGDDDNGSEAASIAHTRVIIVAHLLPLHGERRADNLSWDFRWDQDSILLQLRDGISEDLEVVYVGCLRVDVPLSEQDEVAAMLLQNFSCVPAFLPPDLHTRFYHGFCKQQLWPLFHYMLPLTSDHGGRFDRLLWQSYVSVNKIFADKVMEVISPEDDYVWLHDYHLMVLPTFLRKRFNRIKLGFFLHSPFPSSEIYRTLPVREQILRALLNADLIGFHTFDYARHFLSCCSRMLGLEFESRRGYIGLEYYGRTVGIKIMPVGIHMSQLEAGIKLPETEGRIEELRNRFDGKIVVLGVDDMDIFKGIGLKFLAMEELLNQHPEYRGKLVLVQIGNPARGRGKDVVEVQHEAYAVAKRVNQAYGREGYQPVVLIERDMPLSERIAYYTIAECCIVTAVRDGMNLIPYEYIVCRQGIFDESSDDDGGSYDPAKQKKSMLVVSEFIGCSPSLSGAIRVNPWNIEAVAEAVVMAITMPESEKHARHEKHFKYVSSHDVAYWAQSFISDLERSCKDHAKRHLSMSVGAAPPSSREEAIEQARVSLLSALDKPLRRRELATTIRRKRSRQQQQQQLARFRLELPLRDESDESVASLLLDLLDESTPFRSCLLLPTSSLALRVQESRAERQPIAQIASLADAADVRFDREAAAVVIAEPDSSQLDAVERIVANAGSRAIVVVNPAWVVEDEDDFCSSFKVVYSFTPLSIQGLFFNKTEAVVWKQAAGAPWQILAKDGDDFRCLASLRRRPNSRDVEDALYNIVAANSPVVKSIKFFRRLFNKQDK